MEEAAADRHHGRPLAPLLSLAMVLGRDRGGSRARSLAGVPQARPSARALDRQRRRDARRRDDRRTRATRHRAPHALAVLSRAKRQAGILLGPDRRSSLADARKRAGTDAVATQ